MKLIAGLIMALIAMATAHAEQGDAEDRALMESYTAHQNETPSGERAKTTLTAKQAAPQESAASAPGTK